MKKSLCVAWLALLIAALACSRAAQPILTRPAAAPIPKGDRILAIDVTEGKYGGYEAAFRLAQEAGAQTVSLSLGWDDLETAPQVYQPDPNFLAIANLYYPPQKMPVELMIGPVDTNNLRLPADLKDKPFDDPQVIARYEKLLDYVFSQIPDVELTLLSIGNEVDAYLGGDQAKWQQYQAFFKSTAEYARSLHPGLQVGVKGTFGGMMGAAQPYFRKLHEHSDLVLVTYYPLKADFSVQDPSVVGADFDRLAAAYPDKPIYILEAGYPSGPACNSSPELQAQFIRQVFAAWDRHAAQIKLVDFTWLTDVPSDSVEYFKQYYGVSDRRFVEFLATLGLRTHDGEDKPAFQALKEEASARGW
jgi:hypothetical protein